MNYFGLALNGQTMLIIPFLLFVYSVGVCVMMMIGNLFLKYFYRTFILILDQNDFQNE